MTSNLTPQPNEDQVNAFRLRVTSLPKPMHVENLLASVHRLHPYVFYSNLKNDPIPDDNNNDAPKCALSRLKARNRDAHCPRVSPEFQPL